MEYAKRQAAVEESEAGTRKLKAEVERLELDNKLRELLTGKVFSLVVGWLIFVGVVTLVQSFGWYAPKSGVGFRIFQLPDSVLIGLLVTASGNVIGLLATVLAYYFTLARRL